MCDFAVAGIAIELYLPQFAGASVGVSNGPLVDERCQAAPDVFGAGDVANQLDPLAGRVRSSTATTARSRAARSHDRCSARPGEVWIGRSEHTGVHGARAQAGVCRVDIVVTAAPFGPRPAGCDAPAGTVHSVAAHLTCLL